MTTMTLQEVRQLLSEWGDVPMGHVHMPSEYLRRMRDAIDAHLAKGAQWQPIETAPRDSTIILCYSKNRWTADVSPMKWVDEWKCAASGHRLGIDEQPTHWMPLPAAPMLSQRGEVKGG